MSPLLEISGSIFLATIPALLWGYIFVKRKSEDKRLTFLTFFLGALGVFPILLYKFSWTLFPWLNAFKFAENFQQDIFGFSNLIFLPASVVITFMMVGIIEEIMKLLSVKVADDEEHFRSIDDSIEFFIIAALGFAFTENILYFYTIWITHGPENLILPFIFRSTFSTFAHLIFSGVLGYYYGIAHFASPILQEEIKSKRMIWTRALHKITGIRKDKIFHQQKLLEGLILAVVLHALFNILLEMNLIFLIVPFLLAGYSILNYLFKKKENHKNYQMLLENRRNHSDHYAKSYFEVKPVKVEIDKSAVQ